MDRLALLEAQVFELQHASGWVEDMTPQQALRHAAFRAISGTAGTLGGDQMAAMKVELEAHSLTVPPNFYDRLVAWLQLRLNSSNSDLDGLLTEWARAEGVDDAGLIGAFGPTPPTIVAVAASADDASEVVSSGIVSISDPSIDLQDDRIAGFRFDGVEIPQGAKIASAWVQFTSAIFIVGGGTEAAVVDIQGEDADDAAAFTTGAADISRRTRTTATVEWSLPESSGASAWTIGCRGPNQRTPDLATIVQKIVDRAGWASGNAMAFTLQRNGVGLGSRAVVAQDHDDYKEAVLYVDWIETAGIVAAGLIAEWRFDDGAGQVLNDYVGGFHGTLGTGGGADASDPTWTAAGLSFDGANDFVSIPTMPAIAAVDIVFKTNANISAATAGQALISHANTSTAIGLGSTTGALTNEIIAVIQDSGDYTSNRRVGWTHASDAMASATWHLIQIDFRSGTPTWDILLDGVSKANAIVGTPVALKSGVAWRFGRTFANTQPLAGQIAYVLAYSAARSAPQVAQNRAALATIMAARGITLP